MSMDFVEWVQVYRHKKSINRSFGTKFLDKTIREFYRRWQKDIDVPSLDNIDITDLEAEFDVDYYELSESDSKIFNRLLERLEGYIEKNHRSQK